MDWKKKFREIFKGPYVYDDHGQFIRDQDGSMILNVRGWGKLHTKIGINEAAEIQDAFGNFVAKIFNAFMESQESGDIPSWFQEILDTVEEEWEMGGLADDFYGGYAWECYQKAKATEAD